jgi:hypothetical protein
LRSFAHESICNAIADKFIVLRYAEEKAVSRGICTGPRSVMEFGLGTNIEQKKE